MASFDPHPFALLRAGSLSLSLGERDATGLVVACPTTPFRRAGILPAFCFFHSACPPILMAGLPAFGDPFPSVDGTGSS
jgi:hypothetical protein